MKKVGLVLSTMLVLALVVGCGSKDIEDASEEVTTVQEIETTTEVTTTAQEVETTTEETVQAENNEAAGGESNQSPYIVASAASEEAVEAFAESVKTAIVSSSWSELGDMISYPITIGGTEVADKDAFVSKMNESTVSGTFVSAVSNADCSELFANGQGIMIGNGEVWFLDYAYDAVNLTENGNPDFKIITLNGIVQE